MLYTGKGDKGTTKLFDTKSGERVSKGSQMAEALGMLDELNSFIGFCKVKSEEGFLVNGVTLCDILEGIQENLFIVQAEVAGNAEKKITQEKVVTMEGMIDCIELEIPPITSFTIAGGSEISALLDVARTIARRTERSITRVSESGDRNISDSTRAYMNRLSSVLFALARFVNFKKGIKEKNPSYK